MPVPIPPLAEQEKLVAKVDELMALCDRLQSAQEKRDRDRQKLRASSLDALMNALADEALDQAWAFVRDRWEGLNQQPEDIVNLKTTVFTLAIQGKLVNNSSDDESGAALLKKARQKKEKLIKNKVIKKEKLPNSFIESGVDFSLPYNWEWSRLGYLLTELRNGISKPPNSEMGLRVLRISSVRPNAINLSEFRYLGSNSSEYINSFIKSGDLLFTRYSGNKDFVGICGVVPKLDEDYLYPDKLIRGCLLKEYFVPEFVSLAVNFGKSRDFINQCLKTTAGQVGIAGRDLKMVPIPIPPRNDQIEIVEKSNKFKKYCDRLENSLRQSQEKSSALASAATSSLEV